jgi:hypothetical protein
VGCADQAALDTGVDLPTIAEWTRQVKAERAAALARDASQIRYQTSRRLTEDDICALISSLDDLRDLIRDAGGAEKAAIYEQSRAQGHLRAWPWPGRTRPARTAAWSPSTWTPPS